jgi:hypothetical protein
MMVTSVVVNDFNVTRIAVGPAETDPVLVIDPDAVLTESITLQHLQPISGWCSEETECGRGMQLGKLASDH